MLNNNRIAKMLCDLFTLCGLYKAEKITKEQFFERAEKLADEKLAVQVHKEKHE